MTPFSNESLGSVCVEKNSEPLLGCSLEKKLIIVTQSLPWVLDKTNGKPSSIKRRKGNSSLYSGVLSSAMGNPNTLFIGTLESPYEKEELEQLWKEKRAVVVPANPTIVEAHTHFCTNYLKPVFSYLLWDHALSPSHYSSESWTQYVALNQEVCKTVCQYYTPGDTIWIHDYQLMLLPDMIARVLSDAAIGFFFHSAFPSSELFRCLPFRKDLLEGVLSAKLIGFQNYSYSRHFASSCTRLLGVESTPSGVQYKQHSVSFEIFPLGVVVDKILAKRQSNEVVQKEAEIKELFTGKKIIVGRDKQSQIKGVLHKLLSFERFLVDYGEWHGRVVLIQITSPEHHEDRKTDVRVWEAVSRINGRFGSLDYLPVHYFNQHLDHSHYLALLAAADVGLVTCEREPLNTTAYEFILCQENGKSPLLLSELIGNAGSFSAALLIHPRDYKGVASSLHEALLMSTSDKMLRHSQLFEQACRSSVSTWGTKFLYALHQQCPNGTTQAPLTPLLNETLLVEQYRASSSRLFLLDYDGTLAPITNKPSQAAPSELLLKLLEQLCSDPSNRVFVISGRDQATLGSWLGSIPQLGLSAEHGCFVKFVGEEWIDRISSMDMNWKNEILPVFEYFTERTPGSFIEHKKASLTWHYRLADPGFGSWQAKECQMHLESLLVPKLPVEVIIGKKNLEVRPKNINKGQVIKLILTHYASDVDKQFIFCAGDDRTDEDMFKEINRIEAGDPCAPHFLCHIGSSSDVTLANTVLSSPMDFQQTLSRLLEK